MEEDREEVGRHGGRKSQDQSRYLHKAGKAMARAYDANRNPPFRPDKDWVYDAKYKIYRYSPKNRAEDANESPQNLTQTNIDQAQRFRTRHAKVFSNPPRTPG